MENGGMESTVPPSRRRPGNEPQVICYRDVTLGAAILGGQVDFRLIGGPWWAEFVLAVLGLAAALVRIAFPQDSPDKVTWWRERWRTSRHRGASGKRRTRCERHGCPGHQLRQRRRSRPVPPKDVRLRRKRTSLCRKYGDIGTKIESPFVFYAAGATQMTHAPKR
jgi:hypothetical protein